MSPTRSASRLARLYLLMTPDGPYVGVTTQTLRQRARAHRSAMLRAVVQRRQLSPLHQALYTLEQRGQKPQLRLVAICVVTEAAWRESALIARLRATGMPLLNRSAGGDGGIVHLIEDRAAFDEQTLVISSRGSHPDPDPIARCRLTIGREGRLLRIIGYQESEARLAWIVDRQAMSLWLQQRGEHAPFVARSPWTGTMVRASGQTLSLFVRHRRTLDRLDMRNEGDLTICRFRDSTKHDHILRVATATLIAFLHTDTIRGCRPTTQP